MFHRGGYNSSHCRVRSTAELSGNVNASLWASGGSGDSSEENWWDHKVESIAPKVTAVMKAQGSDPYPFVDLIEKYKVSWFFYPTGLLIWGTMRHNK